MKFPAEMAGFTLSIAGTTITVTLEAPLQHLRPDLTKLYSGFLGHPKKPDAILTISRDDHATYWQPEEDRIALPEDQRPEPTGIVDAVAGTDRLSGSALVVGYRNACLAYEPFSGRGRIRLFRTGDGASPIVPIYRLLFVFISAVLTEHKKLLMHGSGIAIGETGYLFLGESGAGKSTVSGYVKDGTVLSDDSPVLGREGGAFTIYAFPYTQANMFDPKASDYHLAKATLSKLYFLKKDNRLLTEPRDKKSAIGEMVEQHLHCFEYMSTESRKAAFGLCHDLCSRIPMYDLHFQKNDTFWDVIG